MAAPVALERQQTVVVVPEGGENQADAQGQRSAREVARKLVEAHQAGLRSRRQRDLLSELYLLHIDGGGDSQWLDILDGAKIAIPRDVVEFRKSENLLRPIVDNAVAHHTTMPLRYFADSSPDRKAREKALISTLWANYLSDQQDFNDLFAQALYLAMPAGFCPVHGYWREDRMDEHEPVAHAEAEQGVAGQILPQPGMIDCFVGNPFDTVFDPTARRGSIYWASYGRLLPADLVRSKFPKAATLQGSTRIPSAAIYQRIARDWQMTDAQVHGSPVLDVRRGYVEGTDEMLQVLCREVLPGVEPDWPEGRLQVVVIPGEVDFRRGVGDASQAVLVYDDALPAGDFSFSVFYSHHRTDDAYGKPWVEDLDNLQIDLNLALSKQWGALTKADEAPIVGPGGALAEDMLDIGGNNYIEVEPSLAGWRPRVMEWPTAVIVGAYDRIAEAKRKAMYTIGGYQAASRGESPGSRTPYRALVALQNADLTIHGPVNYRFRQSGCDFMRRCWKQMKTYGDVPWLVDIVGDEYAHMAQQYISSAELSDSPPKFKLVNQFGATPELQTQELIEMAQVRGADGQPLISTDEVRRQLPNQRYFGFRSDPTAVARRRAKTITNAIEFISQQVRLQTQYTGGDRADPQLMQLAAYVFQLTEVRYPRLRDDDLQANLASLSELTQDETADPLAREAAKLRQNLLYQWQAAMAAQALPLAGGAVNPAGPGPSALSRLALLRQGRGQPGTTLQDLESTAPRQSATAPGSRAPAPPDRGTARSTP